MKKLCYFIRILSYKNLFGRVCPYFSFGQIIIPFGNCTSTLVNKELTAKMRNKPKLGTARVRAFRQGSGTHIVEYLELVSMVLDPTNPLVINNGTGPPNG